MTRAQVVDACARYAEILDARGAEPLRDSGAVEDLLNHLRWMCGEIPAILDENAEKGMRWFGFVQGALWARGIRSIDAMRSDNR